MPLKPSDKEQEYFAKQEIERARALEKQRQEKLAAEERAKLKALHYMKCPKCGMDLAEINMQSVKVDTCGACHGIWLDAGELDQLLTAEKGAFHSLLSFFKSKD